MGSAKHALGVPSLHEGEKGAWGGRSHRRQRGYQKHPKHRKNKQARTEGAHRSKQLHVHALCDDETGRVDTAVAGGGDLDAKDADLGPIVWVWKISRAVAKEVRHVRPVRIIYNKIIK